MKGQYEQLGAAWREDQRSTTEPPIWRYGVGGKECQGK